MKTLFRLVPLPLLAMPALAQEAAPAPPAPPMVERAPDLSPDSVGRGPWPAMKEVDPALPDHVIYHPRDMKAYGTRKLGVLVWGNGGCRADGASARHHLAQVASYGYIAIAPGGIRSGPGAPPPEPRTPDMGVQTQAENVRAGLDWIMAENARKGSRWYRRIDTKAVAVAGHSCGGLQALQVASDPRIRTVIIHNSGVFTDGTNPIKGITVDKSLLKTLHTPVLYVLGGKGDVAWPNGSDDVQQIAHVPAMMASLDVGHGGTFRQPDGGAVGVVAVNWLNWRLRGDKKAARWFSGADCTLCTDKAWTVVRKAL